VKGVAGRNRRCALCRAEIPQDFLRRPVLVGKDAVALSAAASADRQPLNGGKLRPVIPLLIVCNVHLLLLMPVVGWLEFNIPFQHKYGYIRDDSDANCQLTN